MQENEELIRTFLKAWSRLDAEELAAFFTDDGVYHNMPSQPVEGKDNVRNFIGAFLKTWTATDWEVLTLISKDNVVVAERVDHSNVGGKLVNLPCCGVFEIENGKIKVWRDYFDMATFTRPLASK